MITLDELNPTKVDDPEVTANVLILLKKMNRIREAYGRPMRVTSGVRSMQDHLRIYEQKAKREGKKFDKSKVPMQSKHLYGQAVDIADPKSELKEWINLNLALCESLGLYFEHFDYTPGWVHFQIVQPKSGRRFFLP